MAFVIEFVGEAETDLDAIRAFHRPRILDAIERHLKHKPTQVSRARIKRLHSTDSPAYRLRIGEFRVFYDVDIEGAMVTILRILSKEQSLSYLRLITDEESGTGETE